MDSFERGMNPAEMTMIDPWKEYWPGRGIEPTTSCSQVLYATDLAMGLRFDIQETDQQKDGFDSDQHAQSAQVDLNRNFFFRFSMPAPFVYHT